jgi:hypothetical protein
VTSKKPKSIVTLGFGDGQAFFSFAKLREAGYWIAWTPHTELVHHESASRGFDDSTPKQVRFLAEIDYMNATWGDMSLRDPFSNPKLWLGENLLHSGFPVADD